jgi:hypothetical protein
MTNKAAHHPAYWGDGTHRRALEGEDEKAWAPKVRQADDAEAWLQAKRDYKEAPYVAIQKKPNHTAHQGSGTHSPQVLTALFSSAALFGATSEEEVQGKTGQGVSPANYKKEIAIAHGVRGSRHSHQVLGALSTKKQGKTGQGVSAASFLLAQEPYNLESEKESKAEDAPSNTLDAANQAAMRILVNNRSIRGSRLAWATTTAEAAPSWTGIGADYTAWVQALRQDPA